MACIKWWSNFKWLLSTLTDWEFMKILTTALLPVTQNGICLYFGIRLAAFLHFFPVLRRHNWAPFILLDFYHFFLFDRHPQKHLCLFHFLSILAVFQQNLFDSVDDGILVGLEDLGSNWPLTFGRRGTVVIKADVLFPELGHVEGTAGKLAQLHMILLLSLTLGRGIWCKKG